MQSNTNKSPTDDTDDFEEVLRKVIAPGEPEDVLINIAQQLGLGSEEASYISRQADRYKEYDTEYYTKQLRLYLYFYLATAKEMYGRNWGSTQHALDDENTEKKKEVALTAFCLMYPQYEKCKDVDTTNANKEWMLPLTGGKRRNRKNKRTKKRRTRRHRTRRYR
jgi:hypothetical protein